MASSNQETNLRYVQKISVACNGWFVNDYKIAQLVDGKEVELMSDYSPNISAGNEHTIDLTEFADKLPVEAVVFPIVRAHAGHTERGPHVLYAPNGQTAAYSVTGTTLNVHVKLL